MVFHIGGTPPQDTKKADLQKKDNLESQYAREERLKKAEKEKMDVDIQKALTGSKPNSDENIARMFQNLNQVQAKIDYLNALEAKAKAEAEARAKAEAEAKAEAKAKAEAEATQKREAKIQEIKAKVDKLLENHEDFIMIKTLRLMDEAGISEDEYREYWRNRH